MSGTGYQMTEPALTSPALRAFAGCAIAPCSLRALFDDLLSHLNSGARGDLVGHHNLHSLYLVQKNPRVAEFYHRCRTCYIDGVGVLWLLRAAGIDTRNAARFSLMECLPELLTLAEQHGLRLFYLGSSEATVERARYWIGGAWPGLAMALHHGYTTDSEALLGQINAFKPDLLLVGMGMPRQEAWIMRHHRMLNAGVILQAGGTLDYYTGEQAQPPPAWSRRGMAWLYRLVCDPRRLWRRYLLTPWLLLPALLRLRRTLAKQSAR